MLENEFAVAGLMAVEAKAGLFCGQRLKERLALDGGKPETFRPLRCKRSKA
jgi:hypothetical protein